MTGRKPKYTVEERRRKHLEKARKSQEVRNAKRKLKKLAATAASSIAAKASP